MPSSTATDVFFGWEARSTPAAAYADHEPRTGRAHDRRRYSLPTRRLSITPPLRQDCRHERTVGRHRPGRHVADLPGMWRERPATEAEPSMCENRTAPPSANRSDRIRQTATCLPSRSAITAPSRPTRSTISVMTSATTASARPAVQRPSANASLARPPMRSSYTRHHHEQMEGADLVVRSAIPGERLRIYHELRSDADDGLRTFVHELDHPAIDAPAFELPATAPPQPQPHHRRPLVCPRHRTTRPRPRNAQAPTGRHRRHPRRRHRAAHRRHPPLGWCAGEEHEWVRTLPNGDQYAYAVMEQRTWIRGPVLGTNIQSFRHRSNWGKSDDRSPGAATPTLANRSLRRSRRPVPQPHPTASVAIPPSHAPTPTPTSTPSSHPADHATTRRSGGVASRTCRCVSLPRPNARTPVASSERIRTCGGRALAARRRCRRRNARGRRSGRRRRRTRPHDRGDHPRSGPLLPETHQWRAAHGRVARRGRGLWDAHVRTSTDHPRRRNARRRTSDRTPQLSDGSGDVPGFVELPGLRRVGLLASAPEAQPATSARAHRPSRTGGLQEICGCGFTPAIRLE